MKKTIKFKCIKTILTTSSCIEEGDIIEVDFDSYFDLIRGKCRIINNGEFSSLYFDEHFIKIEKWRDNQINLILNNEKR